MAIKARRCFPAISPGDWVHQVFLTCDNQIAVQFKRGMRVHRIKGSGPGAFVGAGGVPSVCCLYPATKGKQAVDLYDLGLVYPFAGEWVRRFLYDVHPYTLVAPPANCGNCNTSCSINLSPASPNNGDTVTITVRVTNNDGSTTAGAAPQGTVVIAVDGTQLCSQSLPSTNLTSQNWQSVSCTWSATCTPASTHTISATFTPSETDFASTNCTANVTVGGCGQTPCCPNGLPNTLHLTISGSGSCGIDGTYPLVWNTNGWYGTLSNGCAIQFFCNNSTTPPSCGFSLVVFSGPAGDCTLCYEVATCGSSSGTWASTNCSTPNWTSNATNPILATCACLGGAATFTVTL